MQLRIFLPIERRQIQSGFQGVGCDWFDPVVDSRFDISMRWPGIGK
jgi:hypothetical protein